MFRSLQLKKAPSPPPAPPPLTLEQFFGDAVRPVSIRAVNGLAPAARQRLYRLLLPPDLLARFDIHLVTWKARDGAARVDLQAETGTGLVRLSILASADPDDPAFSLELSDNGLNGVDLNLLLLNDPDTPRFRTDFDDEGRPTFFGTIRRNRPEEERAMRAGLAPGQVRGSFGASRTVLQQLDTFLGFLGHQAVFLEPLTYASAWVFERRGFAYVRGHKLMQDIHAQFQPGGRLHQALDGSTPFRRPEHWRTVRGRAWAIHDGLLEAIGATWNNLRMVRQVGREAGVSTFPNAEY